MDARSVVDRALKAHGDLGVYGDLSAGLEALEKEFTVRIEEGEGVLHVDAGPHSGARHDFAFSVNLATGEIQDVVVGEIAPEPEPDDEPEPEAG